MRLVTDVVGSKPVLQWFDLIEWMMLSVESMKYPVLDLSPAALFEMHRRAAEEAERKRTVWKLA